MMLSQLCAVLWDSQSQLIVIQPGIEPGPVVMPLTLRCSVLDRCATRESWGTKGVHILHILCPRPFSTVGLQRSFPLGPTSPMDFNKEASRM
jgi:hypothetical protein